MLLGGPHQLTVFLCLYGSLSLEQERGPESGELAQHTPQAVGLPTEAKPLCDRDGAGPAVLTPGPRRNKRTVQTTAMTNTAAWPHRVTAVCPFTDSALLCLPSVARRFLVLLSHRKAPISGSDHLAGEKIRLN